MVNVYFPADLPYKNKGQIAGTFFYCQGKDIEPAYRVIEDGAWLDESFGDVPSFS